MGWPNLSELVVAPGAGAPVALVGAPLSAGSISAGHCDLAPARLRATLPRIGRYDIDTGHELSTMIADHGDIAVSGMSIEEATGPIRAAVTSCLEHSTLVLLVGGNNAVTRPGVLALGADLARTGLLTLDAHFDMRDLDQGLSNGNPVRALIADGLPGANIAQVGLAPFANSRAMHRDATASGNLVIPLREIHEHGVAYALDEALEHLAHCESILVDCDIDVIDRSQFPAAPGARPGGMTASDFFVAVRRLAGEPRVRVIDLTEWDPPLDPTDLSALTAARWVAECLAGFELR